MERSEFFAVLDGLPWPSFAMSLDQVIVYWGEGLGEMLGYSALSVLGRRCWHLGAGLGSSGLTPDCPEGCVIYRAARAGLVPSSVELDMRTSQGELMRVRVVPVALGHLGWVDRLLVYLLVSPGVAERVGRAVSRAWSGLVSLPDDVSLTPRECEVMALVARGWRNAFIAEELGVTLNTVRSHVANVRVKLGVSTRMEAAMVALRLGFIDLC